MANGLQRTQPQNGQGRAVGQRDHGVGNEALRPHCGDSLLQQHQPQKKTKGKFPYFRCFPLWSEGLQSGAGLNPSLALLPHPPSLGKICFYLPENGKRRRFAGSHLQAEPGAAFFFCSSFDICFSYGLKKKKNTNHLEITLRGSSKCYVPADLLEPCSRCYF